MSFFYLIFFCEKSFQRERFYVYIYSFLVHIKIYIINYNCFVLLFNSVVLVVIALFIHINFGSSVGSFGAFDFRQRIVELGCQLFAFFTLFKLLQESIGLWLISHVICVTNRSQNQLQSTLSTFQFHSFRTQSFSCCCL